MEDFLKKNIQTNIPLTKITEIHHTYPVKKNYNRSQSIKRIKTTYSLSCSALFLQ